MPSTTGDERINDKSDASSLSTVTASSSGLPPVMKTEQPGQLVEEDKLAEGIGLTEQTKLVVAEETNLSEKARPAEEEARSKLLEETNAKSSSAQAEEKTVTASSQFATEETLALDGEKTEASETTAGKPVNPKARGIAAAETAGRTAESNLGGASLDETEASEVTVTRSNRAGLAAAAAAVAKAAPVYMAEEETKQNRRTTIEANIKTAIATKNNHHRRTGTAQSLDCAGNDKSAHKGINATVKKATVARETSSSTLASWLPDNDRIQLGICAMDKKARSKPMAEILSRLDEDLFDVIFFGDDLILNAPIEDWPVCDALIAFFSKGYPLSKVKEYVELNNPFILNDLDMQELLQDRRKVYDLLEASGIDVPRHVYLSRDGYVSTGTGDGNGNADQEVKEFDDHIEVNGVSIHKPFVEKPVNAEDHNIAIYYPTSAGGGCKKLFRKVGNRSSEFYSNINEVRRDGSYIYEEFVETQGTDVKMYTVGPEYGHAEARKSPTVDGKVERNSDGKEVRFPVILNFREKEITRRIVLTFKQFVCGFDILRVQERHSVVSYVCDVNGWSFVKNSRKYYDDCAQILSEHILAVLKPAAATTFSTLDPLMCESRNNLDEIVADDDDSSVRSFRSVKSNRSGDDFTSVRSFRSTKSSRSMKRSTAPIKETVLTRAARLLQGEPVPDELLLSNEFVDSDLIEPPTSCFTPLSFGGGTGDTEHHRQSSSEALVTSELLASAAATIQEGAVPVRELSNNLCSEPASLPQSSSSSVQAEAFVDESLKLSKKRSTSAPELHQEELRCVLAIVRHGDRTPKQKLKVNMTEPHILKFFHDHAKNCQKDLKVKDKRPMIEFLETVKRTLTELKDTSDDECPRYQLTHMRDILERWKISGLNRKLQMKPRRFEEYTDPTTGEIKKRCVELQLILKWGGDLTKLGEKQSINLGQKFRKVMYPDNPGGGILRLHSTFRHDLKIKTSDEGRVMKTAAAFAKGLLELEGDLPPILVSLVHKDKSSIHMLDPSGNKEVKKELEICKEKIAANLQRDINVAEATREELEQLVGPEYLTATRGALRKVKNPRQNLKNIHETLGKLVVQLKEMLKGMGRVDEKRIEGGGELGSSFLSGVKFYDGETLLEITERLQFIYDHLYDAKKNRFDLSRIPDVHDNVRFDVLHNPHLGLSRTLEELYELSKNMADCVVPQEYGTTVSEKYSVGVKICRSLLDKIKNDLSVARTDNDVDMRYMINMDYSADLPINTMGRRIRTRLYFTSESHLHTVLNVLRYNLKENDSNASTLKPLLSEKGVSILNGTNELCYLTQIVIRVFEDNRRDMMDPRRFRVEILFSPGATATPLHMHKTDREQDTSRFDTAPLQPIGREGLTCQEVEDFFQVAITAGRSEDDDDDDGDVLISMSTAPESFKRPKAPKPSKTASVTPSTINIQKDEQQEHIPNNPTSFGAGSTSPTLPQRNANKEDGEIKVITGGKVLKSATAPFTMKHGDLVAGGNKDGPPKDAPCPKNERTDGNDDSISKSITRKLFWSYVAVGSMALGVGCLLTAFRLSDDSRQQRRRWGRH